MPDLKYPIWIDEEKAEEVEQLLDAAGIIYYQERTG